MNEFWACIASCPQQKVGHAGDGPLCRRFNARAKNSL